jgi:nicotinate phosphoribosyltransferase
MNQTAGFLLTDLYQLTMAQAYLDHGMEGTAVFEFFVRKLPSRRNFLLAAGLEQVLNFLTGLSVTEQELSWLERTGNFKPSLLDYLQRLRFTGDLDAVQEGTVVFPQEPMLRVTAPLPQAQLIETRLINIMNFQTMVASKAVRSVLVAGGKPLIDFGLRRAQGAEAGLFAARAAYLAGFTGTSNLLAGARFDIPTYGTMAHSYVQAHRDETTAFRHFAESQPNHVVLLIDTYDTEAAARKVVALAPQLISRGIHVNGVRLDSGDLADHARRVRRILDEGGLTQTSILASGNLDEDRLQELTACGAPIDSFAVGTAMATSADAPWLDCAYKLQEYDGRPCRKRSEGKRTWPGRKQVYRYRDPGGGGLTHDVITLADDVQPGEPLLAPAMRVGRRIAESPPLEDIRKRTEMNLRSLPEAHRRLESCRPFDVRISTALEELAGLVDRDI